MSLTLGNNLAGSVSRTINNSNKRATDHGQSMRSGLNHNIKAVDAFLGRSLEDNNTFLIAIAKNTNYSANMLATAKEYMNILSSTLEKGLKTVSSSGQVSDEKLAILEQSLADTRSQINLLINTASFDKKKVLTGDVRDLGLIVGFGSKDKLRLNITNFGEGRLFRSGVTKQLNTYFSEDPNKGRYYAVFRNQLAQDLIDNKNLLVESLYSAGDKYKLTNRQFAAGLADIRGKVGGTENLKSLSGVVETQFNTAARAKLLSAWTNVCAKHTAFINDPNGAAAAGAAANAIVLGMEGELDLVEISNRAVTAATNADVNGLTGAAVATMINNFLGGGALTLAAAINSHPAMSGAAGGNKFAEALDNVNKTLDDVVQMASEADAVEKAAADALGAAGAAIGAVSAADAGNRAAQYIIGRGGTATSDAIAAGKAAGQYIIDNPPGAGMVVDAATAGVEAAQAAQAAINAAQIAGSPGFADIAAAHQATDDALHGPIRGAPVPVAAAAGAAAAAFVIAAGGNAVAAGTAAGLAAGLAAVAHADPLVSGSANISRIAAAGTGAAAQVIAAGGTQQAAINAALISAAAQPTFIPGDRPSAAGVAAAAYVIENGGIPTDAVEAAGDAAEEAASSPPLNWVGNRLNDAIESAKTAARIAYASVFGDTGVGDVVEDIYMVYRNLPGGYNNNKQGVKIENTNLSIIEKILDNAAAKDELMDRLKDDAVTDLQTDAGRAWSQNLFMAVLDTVRRDQASATDQRMNVIRAGNALRTTNNVTENAKDSYLKTDYVLAAQEYSELLRQIVAAIAALQAAEKIPEAAQQLLKGNAA